MYFYKDNFLPEELFSSLQKRMLWRFKQGDTKDASRIKTHIIENNDYTVAGVILGAMVPDAVLSIKKYLEETYNFKNLQARLIWFQYQNNKQHIGRHYDEGRTGGRKAYQCFSTFIYTHEQWEDNWGGEFCINYAEVLPKTNRLLVHSRDEEHWVNPIKHGLDDYQRMFLGVSWLTDNEFKSIEVGRGF
jgi:hypothetical protein